MTVHRWRKSSRSATNGSCVEVRSSPSMVRIRDSKDPHGPQLSVGTAAWITFVDAVRAGDDSVVGLLADWRRKAATS